MSEEKSDRPLLDDATTTKEKKKSKKTKKSKATIDVAALDAEFQV
jgi:hypothetical protein